MSDPRERLDRFLVAHRHGEVRFATPTKADLVEATDGRKFRITAWCERCGTTIRELVPADEFLEELHNLCAEAGVSEEELRAALEDPEREERLVQRLESSPAMLRVVLAGIRNAHEGRELN